MVSILNKLFQKNKKQIPLVFDVDDVILNSTEAITNILNEKFKLNPPLKEDDNKGWTFTKFKREIKKQKNIELSTKQIQELFQTKEFWDTVQLKDGILDIVTDTNIIKNFKIIFASQGTKENLKHKIIFLKKHFNMIDIEFIGIPLDLDNPSYKKDSLDISNGIQIDDKYSCLNTNASLKILLKNFKETDYNQILDVREDLYEINDLFQLKEILLFAIKNYKEFKNKR